MKSLVNSALSLLLAIGLAGNVNGQDNGQLGLICVFNSNQTALPRVLKINMSVGEATFFHWNTERFSPILFERTVNYIKTGTSGYPWDSAFYINRTTLDGGSERDSTNYSCSLNSYAEIDAFVQREVSKLNNTRAF